MYLRSAENLTHTAIVPAIRKQVRATERQIDMGIEMALEWADDPELGTAEFTVMCVVNVLAAREDDLDEWLMAHFPAGVRNSVRKAVAVAPDGYVSRVPHNYLGYVYVLCDKRTHEFVMPFTETDYRNFNLLRKPNVV